MKRLKRIGKWTLRLLLIPITYGIIALCCTYITVNNVSKTEDQIHTIFLSTNGIHLDLILPKKLIAPTLLEGIYSEEQEHYLGFGWGDKNFYINTPTWGDLTVKNACIALFMNSESLMHVTRHTNEMADWIAIPINKTQLNALNQYLLSGFALNTTFNKQRLLGKGYGPNDDFYEAIGSYSCINTCNSWINTALKTSNIKACLWTPFDFRLLQIHQPN